MISLKGIICIKSFTVWQVEQLDASYQVTIYTYYNNVESTTGHILLWKPWGDCSLSERSRDLEFHPTYTAERQGYKAFTTILCCCTPGTNNGIASFPRYQYLYNGQRRFATDGLNSLKYDLLDVQYKRLYVWVYAKVLVNSWCDNF